MFDRERIKSSPLGFFHPSNLLTYVSLASALAAVHLAASEGSWGAAGFFLGLSVVMDIFDGKFASLFARSPELKAFGSQIDSLVDAVAFGLAPAASLLSLAGPAGDAGARPALGLTAFLFALSAVTRLGYFNIASGGSGGFIGLPTTITGLLWTALFLAQPSAWAASACLLAMAALMVIPLRIPRPPLAVLLGLGLSCLALMAVHFCNWRCLIN